MTTDEDKTSEYWGSYTPPPPGLTPPTCDFFWGSHGCDLPYGHTESLHRCESADDPCSWFDESAPPDRRWIHPFRNLDEDHEDYTNPNFVDASRWYDGGFRFSYWRNWAANSHGWLENRDDRRPS